VIKQLEEKHIQKGKVETVQMPIFETEEYRSHRGVVEKLREIDVNNLTPLEALQALSEMKKDV